ncbi:N-acetylglucosamine-binding protein GbpA [Superficieibacter electus]|uniref:N-acetylglucosamine-binding protein GbpA n=1 Tax=Superficieibacter electus TaxID=2022662 RepID=A0A2P5GQ97_9ENTR|nr:N-acetylglucosamine-binding protein GbpA [Superficieibacter electus]POP45590.1 N-acetylglucosamine-binding protein GbpA [Superficieibacter electus]POP48751.1 N-acetylglucosamine-binding protein GbpA [Superficieibacter electus]
MKIKKASLCIATLLFNAPVFAHGYVESPASRAFQCKSGNNANCGSVQWEPQSVEQTSGFPEGAMPPDGQLASAGKSAYSPLDEQSPTRWVKTPIKSGKNNFSWYHTAPHRTTNWRYYITKQNWDQNKPLTRDDFENKPFCIIDGHGNIPATQVTHSCNVPQRTGYQVIYAVWEIADTANSFYQAIDVDFGNGASGEDSAAQAGWTKTLNGIIQGGALKAGDRVVAKFFNAYGEVPSLRTTLTITSDDAGASTQWPWAMANAINAAHPDLRAGIKNAEGTIEPVHGANMVYAKEGSDLETMILYTGEEAATSSLTVSDVAATAIDHGNATVTLRANAQGHIQFEANVSDHSGNERGQISQSLRDQSQTLTIKLTGAQAGHHMLRYVGRNDAGDIASQGVVDLMLKEKAVQPTPEPAPAIKYQYVFPAHLNAYKAGTRVLQPKDSKVYQCRPFPYSGYCVQWSRYANQYEPGVGFAWKMAWTVVTE